MDIKSNPYPEMITDESSGIKVPGIAHQIWLEGFEAAMAEATSDEICCEDDS